MLSTGRARFGRRFTGVCAALVALALAMLPATAAAKAGDAYIIDAFAFGGDGALFHLETETGALGTTAVGAPFEEPRGLEIDHEGRVLVNDQSAFGGLGALFAVDPSTGGRTTLVMGPPFDTNHGIA